MILSDNQSNDTGSGKGLIILRRSPLSSAVLASAVTLQLLMAGPARAAAAGDAPDAAPQQNFLQSLSQAFKQDYENAVVRGHFETGTTPGEHRYYCLVNAKTGKTQPNGVSGEPVMRPDGMTGIKATAVSVFSCASAEQRGLLVTRGYVLTGAAAKAVGAPDEKAAAPAATAAAVGSAAAAPAAVAAAPPGPPQDWPDVAGVKLGMSVQQVRAVLGTRTLRDYYESTRSLGRAGSSGRFVNVIAAWTPAAGGSSNDEESIEVMFTPVPGKERAMAVIHTAVPAATLRETTLADALVSKYGGFPAGAGLPVSPTWRLQSEGPVQVNDACNRRVILAGAAELKVGGGVRQNIALKTTPEEFRFQIDNCGVALITEDHTLASAGAARDARVVTRYTVTAYSPSIAFEGAAAAAQLMSGGDASGGAAPRIAERATPAL